MKILIEQKNPFSAFHPEPSFGAICSGKGNIIYGVGIEIRREVPPTTKKSQKTVVSHCIYKNVEPVWMMGSTPQGRHRFKAQFHLCCPWLVYSFSGLALTYILGRENPADRVQLIAQLQTLLPHLPPLSLDLESTVPPGQGHLWVLGEDC